MWKILTVQISEEIYYSTASCGLFPKEQKKMEPEEQVIYCTLINTSSKGAKWIRKMTSWIDYKKIYNMIQLCRIIDCLKVYKISNKVIIFIKEAMKNWKIELTAGEKSLAEVKIQREIFQGDTLSPILFVIAMIPLNHILRKCISGYKFTKSKEKINQLMYIDDIKVFAVKEKWTYPRKNVLMCA